VAEAVAVGEPFMAGWEAEGDGVGIVWVVLGVTSALEVGEPVSTGWGENCAGVYGLGVRKAACGV